ncbi:Uncharacterised protein [Mycobacteroides abscessus subsp. massiliense]|nr:Uncharacterised protein [Mycobacteroides abscessus subsp. massiliense]
MISFRAFSDRNFTIGDFDVCQTFCAVDADKFSVFVDFFAAEFRAVRYAQSDYAAAFHVGCATEDFEFFRFHQVG